MLCIFRRSVAKKSNVPTQHVASIAPTSHKFAEAPYIYIKNWLQIYVVKERYLCRLIWIIDRKLIRDATDTSREVWSRTYLQNYYKIWDQHFPNLIEKCIIC
jgi:hypothetical protein